MGLVVAHRAGAGEHLLVISRVRSERPAQRVRIQRHDAAVGEHGDRGLVPLHRVWVSPSVHFDDWFLTTEERGNPATEIDRRRGDGTAWTEGNRVEVLVDGAEYFARLYEVLCTLGPDDWVHFTDWEGDPDERLVGPGTEVGHVLADLARKRCARARSVVALASATSALQRAAEHRARPRGQQRGR